MFSVKAANWTRFPHTVHVPESGCPAFAAHSTGPSVHSGGGYRRTVLPDAPGSRACRAEPGPVSLPHNELQLGITFVLVDRERHDVALH